MHRSKLLLALLPIISLALAVGESQAVTLTTLARSMARRQFPAGSLTLGANGSTLYGTTQIGGPTSSDGTVFSIPVTGGTITDIAPFTNTNVAGDPEGPLTLIGSKLYGMTPLGHTVGAVFCAPVAGGSPTVIASFNGTNGSSPQSGSLTPSADGSTLYGMTPYGGNESLNQGIGYGTAFSVPVADGTPHHRLRRTFDGTHGGSPGRFYARSRSTLYRMTSFGGANGDGAIFSMPVTGGTPTLLASFNGTNGAGGQGNLTLSADGQTRPTFYGMAEGSGQFNHGTIFSIPVAGGTPTVLASFNGMNGANPLGSLTLIGSTLYGMTQIGGSNGDGVIFSIPVTRRLDQLALVSFNGMNGIRPRGDLTVKGSTLYGLTSAGGAIGDGTVFALALPERHRQRSYSAGEQSAAGRWPCAAKCVSGRPRIAARQPTSAKIARRIGSGRVGHAATILAGSGGICDNCTGFCTACLRNNCEFPGDFLSLFRGPCAAAHSPGLIGLARDRDV